jgi:hypothetical protein
VRKEIESRQQEEDRIIKRIIRLQIDEDKQQLPEERQEEEE